MEVGLLYTNHRETPRFTGDLDGRVYASPGHRQCQNDRCWQFVIAAWSGNIGCGLSSQSRNDVGLGRWSVTDCAEALNINILAGSPSQLFSNTPGPF